ncbi:MAG: VWA domain-containing protein [Proteobacteria bacterium]|nr:VWA domain-containing protein [Pseudomonadota bacterium]
MKRRKRIKFILFSFLIHLGILRGIDVFLIPVPGPPEEPAVIPVETIFLEEEEGKKGHLGELPPLTSGTPKGALIAKSLKAVGTPGPNPLEDLPGPVPKQGAFNPSQNVEEIPTPGVLPPGEKGKEVESRRIVSPSMNPLPQLPAIPPVVSDQPPVLQAEKPKVLTQAEEGGIPTYSMTLEKTRAPLGRSRKHPEFISDLAPIPTVESPVLPEESEMVLARQGGPEPDTSTLPSLTFSEVSKQARHSVGERRSYKPFTEKMTAFEPLLGLVERQGPLMGIEEGFSLVLVIDTSGSVKGPPLEGIKKSATEFVSLLRDVDRCAVMTFNDETNPVRQFTSNKNRLKREISKLEVEGRNTVLFDALNEAFLLLEREGDKRRFVVLFSDGKDEGSSSTLDDVIDRARKFNVSVFSVGYSRIEKNYLQNLESISLETGGIFTEAPQFRELVELFRTARKPKKKKG